jgi:hypothetical protein
VSYDCFISYASADIALAEALYRRLTEADLSVWLDRARLQPGYDWHREIEKACDSIRVILPILTPRWKLSDWTRFETYGAECILPLIGEGKIEDIVTPPLARLQAVPVDDPNLPRAIRAHLAQPAPEKAPRLARF